MPRDPNRPIAFGRIVAWTLLSVFFPLGLFALYTALTTDHGKPMMTMVFLSLIVSLLCLRTVAQRRQD